MLPKTFSGRWSVELNLGPNLNLNLHPNRSVCAHVCVCACVCACACVRAYACVYVYIYICIRVCVCVYSGVCKHVGVWVCYPFWFINHPDVPFNLHRTVQGPKSISVWHESDAEGDEWKLDSIMVKDLTHKRLHKFTFGVDGMAGLKSTLTYFSYPYTGILCSRTMMGCAASPQKNSISML